jgi:exonuclease SbcD
MLVGNHDIPPTQLKASSIEIYDTLAVPNVWVADNYELKVVDTKRGPVAVGTAPYPVRARILEHTPTMGLTIAETDAILQEQLVQILDDLAEEADQQEMPRLLTGHFTIGGAVIGSERAIMLGRDISVPKTAVMDSRWDYVAMGHIHKHQNMTGKREDAPPVVYSGSIERIDFGEEGDPKGFCWIELQRGATKWKFEKLNARPFVTLKADLKQDESPTQTVIKMIDNHDLKQAIVRLVLQLTPESEARLNEGALYDALRRAQTFFIAAIRKDVEQPARARLGGSPEGMTPEQLLERYLISREIPAERRNELMSAAQPIFDNDRAT